VRKLQVLNSLSSISEQFLHTLQLIDASKIFCDIDEKNMRNAMKNVRNFFARYTESRTSVTDLHFSSNPINIRVC